MLRDNSLEIMQRKSRWKYALFVLWILLSEIVWGNKELLLPRNKLKMLYERNSDFIFSNLCFPLILSLKNKIVCIIQESNLLQNQVEILQNTLTSSTRFLAFITGSNHVHLS